MTRLFDQQQRPLRIGAELGRGGEASVHAVIDDPAQAAKLYLHPDPNRKDKLEIMIERAPLDPARASGHVSIAWPEALLLDAGGGFCGFTMPRLDLTTSLPLHQLYHPGTRRKRAPGISWRYLVRAARNLCAILAALHRSDHVVGDLNESNILVNDRALVTLVDLDSIQVRHRGRTYACPVGKAEYTPPELLDRDFRSTTRLPLHDRFGLAVLIHLLLMEGVHPFTGVYRGEGEPPGLTDNIAARRSPLLGSPLLAPSPALPPPELLSPALRRLLRRGLGGRPRLRPDAERWQRTLEAFEASLETCPRTPTHVYGRHLDDCPWCARSELLGIDPFPTTGALRSAPPRQPTIPVPEPPPPLPGFRGSPRAFFRNLPMVTLLLLAGISGLSAVAATLLLKGFASHWSPVLALGAALTVLLTPPLASLGALYLRTRNSPLLYRALRGSERAARAVLGATVIALAASLALGRLTGAGSVLAGDWLLLPSLWLLAFLGWRRWERRG